MAKTEPILNFLKTGNYSVLLVGILLAVWLNEILSPQLISAFGLPYNPYALTAILGTLLSIVVIIDLFLFYRRRYKKLTLTWFFVGASLVSLVYAAGNLYQISVLYNTNVKVENYSFPAIYVFKLFRSIFLFSVFGIIGYWNELNKKQKNVEIQNVSTASLESNKNEMDL